MGNSGIDESPSKTRRKIVLSRRFKLLARAAVLTLLTMMAISLLSLHKLKPPVQSLPDWIYPFSRDQFLEYQSQIDRQMLAHQNNVTSGVECIMPFYDGEFGYELAVMVPWAYHWSRFCHVITTGLAGTKYLYYFSKSHTIVKGKRGFKFLPDGNPFRSPNPHTDDNHFPKDNWLMPPWSVVYKRDLQWEKPLLMISNKYTNEWDMGPVNFLNPDVLRDLLLYLVPKYNVVYIRLEHDELDDDGQQKVGKLEDKSMIRKEFPSVALLDELIKGLQPNSANLLLLSLGALCRKFISVQGGNSVLASMFSGENIILAKKGSELGPTGDFTYYHRFSNAAISVVMNEADLIDKVKRDF